MKVLVIDDDRALLDVMKQALVYKGYKVDILSETHHVFTEILKYKPDVVVIDYLLKNDNGGEICHRIKNNPLTSNIPVIIMSAFSNVFLSLGNYNCDLFISKPFNLSELFEGFELCTGGLVS